MYSFFIQHNHQSIKLPFIQSSSFSHSSRIDIPTTAPVHARISISTSLECTRSSPIYTTHARSMPAPAFAHQWAHKNVSPPTPPFFLFVGGLTLGADAERQAPATFPARSRRNSFSGKPQRLAPGVLSQGPGLVRAPQPLGARPQSACLLITSRASTRRWHSPCCPVAATRRLRLTAWGAAAPAPPPRACASPASRSLGRAHRSSSLGRLPCGGLRPLPRGATSTAPRGAPPPSARPGAPPSPGLALARRARPSRGGPLRLRSLLVKALAAPRLRRALAPWPPATGLAGAPRRLPVVESAPWRRSHLAR